jgi:hypothetical protein
MTGCLTQRLWAALEEPWRESFRQAWEALRSGNIAVGACACTPAEVDRPGSKN